MNTLKNLLIILVILLLMALASSLSGCCNKKPSPSEPIKTDTRYNPETQYAELDDVK